MSNSMFGKLKKLAGGHFGYFKNTPGLRRELRHLRDIGYVTVKGRVGSLPNEGGDLSSFVVVTSVGKQFVELRTALQGADTG